MSVYVPLLEITSSFSSLILGRLLEKFIEIKAEFPKGKKMVQQINNSNLMKWKQKEQKIKKKKKKRLYCHK